MLYQCEQAKFLIKHGKFREHASKASMQHAAKFSTTSKNFTKLYRTRGRIVEKHLRFSQNILIIFPNSPKKFQRAIQVFIAY